MKDKLGRNIEYLRVSLTDRCNLRCKYCMPESGIESKVKHEDILTLEEMYKLIKLFVELGIKKVRFTGGEPLVRLGAIDLIKKTAKLKGVEEVVITSNGILLEDKLYELKEAGVKRVNISLDSLNEETYTNITGGGELKRVLAAIDKAIELEMTPVRINTVLMGGINEHEIIDFAKLTLDKPIDVRFIELMPIGKAKSFARSRFISNDKVLEELEGLELTEKLDKSSPAIYYKLKAALGSIGLINPLSHKFCSDCNRIRLTPEGMLKTCLLSNKEIDLKTPLRQGDEILKIIKQAIENKEQEHHLENQEYITRSMNKIGG